MNAKISEIKRSRRPYFSLFAGMLALCIAPPFANGEEQWASEDADVQRIASAYYAKKYSVDLREAERRLTIQDRGAGIEDDIVKVLGDQYAGVWYDEADAGKLKIGMTQAAGKHADEVRQITDRYGIAAATDLVAVRFTEAELEAIQSCVRKSIEDMIEAGRARTSYNTKSNTVVVTALATLPRLEEARVKGLAEISGVIVRRVDVPALLSKLNACNVTFCNPPFRGGRFIRRVTTHAECTAAFIARDNTNPNQLWVLTAGHCIFFAGLPWEAKDESNNFSVIGFSAFFSFSGAPGRDAGKISISSGGGWATPTALPAVVVKSSSNPLDSIIFTNYNPNYEIKATSLSSIGKVLCRTGMKTGTECGTVIELGADESSVGPDGKTFTFHHMGRLDVCDTQNGDSGGPLYKTHLAFGIYSGTGDCYEVYQGVRAAESALNVKVIVAP